MRRENCGALLTMTFVLLLGMPASAGTMLNTGGQTLLRGVVRDTNVSFTPTFTDKTPSALPYSDSHLVTVGAAGSTSVYDFSDAAFNVAFDHVRPGRLDSSAVSQGDIFFSVDIDALYSVNGSYTAIDSNPRHINLDARLTDLDTGTILFDSVQASGNTANESFILGQMGGDANNVFTGSLAGSLLAGHRYQFSYQSQIYANSTDDGATASGNISLGIVAVPTPSAVYAGMVGLGVLALIKRWKRPHGSVV